MFDKSTHGRLNVNSSTRNTLSCSFDRWSACYAIEIEIFPDVHRNFTFRQHNNYVFSAEWHFYNTIYNVMLM